MAKNLFSEEEKNDLVCLMKRKKVFLRTRNDELAHMLSHAASRTVDRGAYVYREGAPVEAMYIVFSGKVEISKLTDRDNLRIFCILSAGDVFGVPELFEPEHAVSARAMTGARVAVISKQFFFDHCLVMANVVCDFFKMFANVISMSQREMCIESDERKVLGYLNFMKSNLGEQRGERIYIKRTKTYDTLSKMLFMSREYVSKILNSLKNESVIDINDEYIVILDPARLEDNSVGQIVSGYYDGSDEDGG